MMHNRKFGLAVLLTMLIGKSIFAVEAEPSVPFIPTIPSYQVSVTILYEDVLENLSWGVEPGTPCGQLGGSFTFAWNTWDELRYNGMPVILYNTVPVRFKNRPEAFTMYHITPGGFIWDGGLVDYPRSSSCTISVPDTKISFKILEMGRGYAGAAAFLTFKRFNDSNTYASDYVRTNADGVASMYVDADTAYDFTTAMLPKEKKNLPEYPSLDAPPSSPPLWQPQNPAVDLDNDASLENEIIWGESVNVGSTTSEIVIVNNNRPDYNITGWGYYSGSNVVVLDVQLEDVSAIPGHAFCNFYTIDAMSGAVIWEGNFTGSTGEFLAYGDTDALLYIQAVDTKGRIYAHSTKSVHTPMIPASQTNLAKKQVDLKTLRNDSEMLIPGTTALQVQKHEISSMLAKPMTKIKTGTTSPQPISSMYDRVETHAIPEKKRE